VSESEFERLKELLLGAERAALDAHAARLAGLEQERLRIEALEQARKDLPKRLPQLLERAGREDGPRLARALSEPVASALGGAVRQQRQAIVDALFPVIGPIIRKAIAESLRALVGDLNRALESSFTPRGLRWRFEAWRTGASYAEVVLHHTMRFRIDHLFLIERDSGLVMYRESAPDLPDLDSDAISGMLTALGEFVKDSVGRTDGAALESARVGEHLVMLLEGPRLNLAAFVRGVPPPALRESLQARLEIIHARLADPMAAIDARDSDLGMAFAEQLSLQKVDDAVRQRDQRPASAPSRLPLAIAAGLVVALVAGLWLRDWMWSRRMGRLEAVLQDWPGFYLQGLDADPWDWVRVRGLIDPQAESLRMARAQADFRGADLVFDVRGFVSNDAEMVVRRARSLLSPPAGVQVSARAGVLSLSGTAPIAWAEDVATRAAAVPGVVGVDASGLRPDVVGTLAAQIGVPDGVALDFARRTLTVRGAASREWITRLGAAVDRLPEVRKRDFSALVATEQMLFDGLVARMDVLDIPFAEETTPTAAARGELDGAVVGVRRGLELAALLGRALQVQTLGLTDEVGSEAYNRDLRERRARWLADALRRQVPDLEVAAYTPDPVVDPRAAQKRRAARVLLSLREGDTP
jgi:hypothetical protein